MEDSLPKVPAQKIENTHPALSFPSPEELSSIEYKKLGALFLENHTKLLARVKVMNGRIPYFGLHGLKRAEDLEPMLKSERPYFQVVTTFEKSDDPVVTLNDLYDVVGGDSYYFRVNSEQGFVVFNLEKESKSIARKWGEDGEAKGWAIAGQGHGSGVVDREFFQSKMGLDVNEEASKFFGYFQSTGRYQGQVPHAQKSDLGLISREEIEARVMGSFSTSTTPLYLLNTSLATPELYVRHFLQEMLYVQYIVEKLLDTFEKVQSK